MSRPPGKDFEDRIRKRLEQSRCQVFKLRDSPTAFIRGPEDTGPVTTSFARFSNKNPYDLRVDRRATDTTFHIFALELKTVARGPFPVSMLKDHQRDGLSKFWGVAGVVFESRHVRRCWFIPIGSILGWEHKKSMNLRDLYEVAVELPYDTRGREQLAYYDMAPLLAGAKPKAAQGEIFEAPGGGKHGTF